MRIQPSRGRRRWTKAKVLKKVAPRSYTVQTEAGSILRRNRRQLRTSPGEVLDNANPQERCEYSYENTQKDLKLEKNRSGQVEKKNLKKAKPAGPKNLKNSKEQQEMEDQ